MNGKEGVLEVHGQDLIVVLPVAFGDLDVIIDQVTDDVAYLRVEGVFLRRATQTHFEKQADGVRAVIQTVIRIFSHHFLFKEKIRHCLVNRVGLFLL